MRGVAGTADESLRAGAAAVAADRRADRRIARKAAVRQLIAPPEIDRVPALARDALDHRGGGKGSAGDLPARRVRRAGGRRKHDVTAPGRAIRRKGRPLGQLDRLQCIGSITQYGRARRDLNAIDQARRVERRIITHPAEILAQRHG
jgi:hypothetical protein